MALSARDDRISRRSWLMAGLALPLFRLRAAPSLAVTCDGDNIHVAAPDLHFLTGKPLERLKNADTVVYLSQMTLFGDRDERVILKRVRERLIVSYALWEETFAVTIPEAPVRSQSSLTAAQAESWCLDNLVISTLSLPSDLPFWLKLELRTTPQRDLSVLIGESGISLSRALIDIMSRKAGADDPSWTRSAGPYRLADLPRTTARGNRG
jgi:hypothetical protein